MNYVSKLWKRANANVESSSYLDWVSDMECYTKEELKARYLEWGEEWGEEQEVNYANGLWSVEWGTIYGRHWVRYEDSEAFDKALAENEARWKAEVLEEYERLRKERSERIKARKESRNTLGNLFPELNKLR